MENSSIDEILGREIKIERGLDRLGREKSIYPWAVMSVGDYVELPKDRVHNAKRHALKWSKKIGGWRVFTAIETDTKGIWRLVRIK